MTQPIIRFEGVSKAFGTQTVLRDFSLDVEPGAFVSIIGRSGCGKTTVLKLVNGLLSPDTGRVLIQGQDVARIDPVALRRRIGYAIQNVGLFPHMTVEKNIAYVPAISGMEEWKGKQCREKVAALLKQVGLDPALAGRYPRALSGGQRQRVGIAQAILGDPPFLIFDEPTVGLDPEERIHFRNLFSHAAQDRLVLLSTHIIEDVQSVCDRIVVIHHGRIRFVGTPEQLIQAAQGHVGIFWEQDAQDAVLEQGLHITARVNTSRGIRCRAVADVLPAYVKPEEPSLEDAYLYLIAGEAVQ